MIGSTKATRQESKGIQKQYERVVMASLDICQQYIGQLQNIGAVLAAALRNPPLTEADRSNQLKLLRATLAITERYACETEADYTLMAAIARDARGLPSCETSTKDATVLLAQRATASTASSRSTRNNSVQPFKLRGRRASSRAKHRPQIMRA